MSGRIRTHDLLIKRRVLDRCALDAAQHQLTQILLLSKMIRSLDRAEPEHGEVWAHLGQANLKN